MIKILKAFYDVKDVKEVIEKCCINNNILRIPVTNYTLQCDPAPGKSKKLFLEFEYNGELINYIANEGENFLYPKEKYKKENTLVLTSCNRVEQVLFAIAVNKEIIKENFNLVVADCSTSHLNADEAILMHKSDDPYNLINSNNYNSNWMIIEDYVKTINKIKKFQIIHISPRLGKEQGEATLTSLGLNAASLMGSKYALKLTGVCHLKYDIFSKLNDYIKDTTAATWYRTGVNHISSRVFACRPDKLGSGLINAGWIDWISNEYDFVERKLEKIINETNSFNHMDLNEVDIIVDEGYGRNDHRQILYNNLEKHNLLDSNDIWIRKFLNGGIW